MVVALFFKYIIIIQSKNFYLEEKNKNILYNTR